MKFKNKKLLMLGTTVSSCDIVKYAKSEGAYTIVADYLEDSAAKKIADKSYNISTADIDRLYEMAKRENVDGVISGAHEFNIRKAIELSEMLGTNSYISLQQWEITSKKDKFKALCRENNIPVIEEYDWEKVQRKEEKVQYPVIVKPVDGTGSDGISIANCESELFMAVEIALEKSIEKKVIIEEYLCGQEVVVYYTAQDGFISLSAMCDRYTNKDAYKRAPLPTAYIFPSDSLQSYKEEEDFLVRKMFDRIGVKNAFLFLQGFVVENKVVFYEMGLRIAGAQGHKVISEMNGVNPLEMLVDYTLTGRFGDCNLKEVDNPDFQKYVCKLTPLLKRGKIEKVIGLSEIAKMPEVFDIANLHKEGDEILGNGTLRDVLTRIYLKADTKEDLCKCIDKIQKILRVININGEDMLREAFDTKIILEKKE